MTLWNPFQRRPQKIEVTVWRNKIPIWKGLVDPREPTSISIDTSQPTTTIPETITVALQRAR